MKLSGVRQTYFHICLALIFLETASEKLTDVLLPTTTNRVARDNKYYTNRYGSDYARNTPATSLVKTDRLNDAASAPIEKRCSHCNTDVDSRYGDDYQRRYDDRYDDRYDRYDRYRDRDRYDDYDRKYDDRDRYGSGGTYERPSYGSRPYNRRPDYYDRYDRYDRYDDYPDRDRYYDRGVGYDNRGYDYRDSTDRGGYRPWDETTRGTSGWDSSGRGYYYASKKPTSAGTWGYAGSWGYGGDRDDVYRDRWRNQDYGGSKYRPRDTYDYRGTSYLYGRPSSATTIKPISSSTADSSGADNNQQQDNPSSG